MAQAINPAYYSGQQWTHMASCGTKSNTCQIPWWFIVGVILAATSGGTKRYRAARARRKAAAK